MKSKLYLFAITVSLVACAACTPGAGAKEAARGPHDAEEKGEEKEHDEPPDPRLQDPKVIEAASRVKVLPGELECSAEVVGLVDVHEPMKSTAEGLEVLRRRAALLGAEAVVGVEFEHGEGGNEKTHLSGTAVRCNDLLRGRKYDVIGQVEASAEMEHEEEALASLKRKATARGANLIIQIHFEHGEGDRTKLTGTAIHAYNP
jgi:uncharacterized protein YbjQ (UPF0145 family)